MQLKVSHPFSVAIHKDNMYWDDWRSNAIFMADKDNGTGIQVVANSLPGLMDLKVIVLSRYSETCVKRNLYKTKTFIK